MSEPTRAGDGRERIFYGPWVNNFLKSVKARGEFAEKLRLAGYDPYNPPDKYSVPTFLNLLALVRRHLFPDLPPSEGYRRVGRYRLASHFESGIGGKLWAKAFPLIGPERVIQGAGKFGSSGNNFIEVEAIKEGDRRWRLTFRHTGGVPGELVAGSLEYALELAGTPPSRKVLVTHADDANEQFDLEATW